MDNLKDFYERAFLAALTGLCANPEMWGREDQAHPLAYVGRSKAIAQAAVDAMFKAEESKKPGTWKAVPVEPTSEMFDEWSKQGGSGNLAAQWSAILAAAPAKPGDEG